MTIVIVCWMHAAKQQDSKRRLRALDASMRALLAGWFSSGFLDLRRLSWQTVRGRTARTRRSPCHTEPDTRSDASCATSCTHQCSGELLEKLVRYESVHALQGWGDLKRRLGGDPLRRCYGFFHPQLPGEPLVFIEVALMRDIPHAIADVIPSYPSDSLADANFALVDVARDANLYMPHQATTAVFYSINATQPGAPDTVLSS